MHGALSKKKLFFWYERNDEWIIFKCYPKQNIVFYKIWFPSLGLKFTNICFRIQRSKNRWLYVLKYDQISNKYRSLTIYSEILKFLV